MVDPTPSSLPSFPKPRLWTPEEVEPFDTAFRPAVVLAPKPRGRPDGDTFDVSLDLGYDRGGEKVRLRLTGESWLTSGRKIGFNAWERKGDEKEKGDAAYQRRVQLCGPEDDVLVRSFKGGVRGSLNRWLGLVLVQLAAIDLDGDLATSGPGWYSLADVLLYEGHGREWWRGWNRGAERPDA